MFFLSQTPLTKGGEEPNQLRVDFSIPIDAVLPMFDSFLGHASPLSMILSNVYLAFFRVPLMILPFFFPLFGVSSFLPKPVG